ncbi:hypothetical protein Gohar_023038, partial [Gossypium harknessii]|nr:hypothetical protein [Gossypium harknessii]
HGESFCPLRLQIDPSKIVFGWDSSIRATGRRRNTVMSKWLRAADGTQCTTENFAGVRQELSSNEGKDLRQNIRGVVGCQNINPNLIPLGYGRAGNRNKFINGHGGGSDMRKIDGIATGALELVLNEEDDPIALLEGKKRQRIVENSRVPLEDIVGSNYMDISASSGGQSSREQ